MWQETHRDEDGWLEKFSESTCQSENAVCFHSLEDTTDSWNSDGIEQNEN